MSNGVWSQTDFRNARDFAMGKMEKKTDTLIITVSSERSDIFSGGAVDKVTIETVSGGKVVGSRSGLMKREYLEELLSNEMVRGPFMNLGEILEDPNAELRVEMNKTLVDSIVKLEKSVEKLEKLQEKLSGAAGTEFKKKAKGKDFGIFGKAEAYVNTVNKKLDSNPEWKRGVKKVKEDMEKILGMAEDPKSYKAYLHDTQTGEMYDLQRNKVVEGVPSLISKAPEGTEKKKPKKPLRA